MGDSARRRKPQWGSGNDGHLQIDQGPEATGRRPERGPVSGEGPGPARGGGPGRSTRWLAPTAMTATTAGPMVAGFQGNTTIAVISAAPTLVVGLLLFFGVVCPAVWSTKPQRQRAALKVMNTLIGRSPTRTPASR
ncbi:hypothetical protein ACFVVA_16385 [Kitasatospora sp. NPDC058048]|uniref:hypothetical protein n=1 Tax=Kitasatospora sp. NPDC058048 TaxID=3346313 RepID=UPI0036DE7920